MTFTEVSKNIVVANLNNLGGNITCINLEKSLIFIDTGYLVNDLIKFRNEMEEKYSKKTSHLILTHHHNDHVFAMKAFHDVPIIASNLCRKIIEERMNDVYTVEGLEKIKEDFENYKPFFNYMGLEDKEINEALEFIDIEVRVPDITFEKEYILEIGNDKIIISLTGGHSGDSSTR